MTGRRSGPEERRREDSRMESVARGPAVRIVVDGEDVDAFEGESVAAALLAAGQRVLRWTAVSGEARGYFCGSGICQECLVTVDGRTNVRACITPVRDGLRVDRQRGLGSGTGAREVR